MDESRHLDPRTDDVSRRLRELETAVERLSQRVEALESSARIDLTSLTPEQTPPWAEALSAPTSPSADGTSARAPGWLTLAGRTFIVLAGAFLLRALTDSRTLPPRAGIWVGLAYASVWIVMAARTHTRSSLVHGLAALMVGLPLVFEAGARFQVFTAGASAIVLVALAGATLGVASLRRLGFLALAGSTGAIVTAFAVAMALDSYVAPSVAIVLMAIGAFWVGELRAWTTLAWPGAALADLAALFLAVRASATPARDAPVAALLVLALLIVLYLGSTMARVLRPGRVVRPFDILQTTAVLTVGLGGATTIAGANGLALAWVGVPALVAGLTMYLQAFSGVRRRHGAGREFYYAGMTALAFLLVAAVLLLPAAASVLVIAGAALAASVAAWRVGHPMLALQGAIAAITAAAIGGLVNFTVLAWVASSDSWNPVTAPMWIVLAAVAAALRIPRATGDTIASAGDETAFLIAVARAALTVALVAGTASITLTALAPVAAGTPADPGILATVRTVVLAGVAAVLALVARRAQFIESAAIAYGILALGGLKILVEDLPRSRPATLFIALAVYGAALIFVPKTLRSDETRRESS